MRKQYTHYNKSNAIYHILYFVHFLFECQLIANMPKRKADAPHEEQPAAKKRKVVKKATNAVKQQPRNLSKVKREERRADMRKKKPTEDDEENLFSEQVLQEMQQNKIDASDIILTRKSKAKKTEQEVAPVCVNFLLLIFCRHFPIGKNANWSNWNPKSKRTRSAKRC